MVDEFRAELAGCPVGIECEACFLGYFAQSALGVAVRFVHSDRSVVLHCDAVFSENCLFLCICHICVIMLWRLPSGAEEIDVNPIRCQAACCWVSVSTACEFANCVSVAVVYWLQSYGKYLELPPRKVKLHKADRVNALRYVKIAV